MQLVAALEHQAGACAELGSPMYGELLTALAADVAAGGPTARVLAGHESDPGPSALALRLLGSVHRLVLEGEAPALAAFYPSAGGVWDPVAGPRAVIALLDAAPERVREWLGQAPQTNEVGRSAALMAGLLEITRVDPRPIRLVEVGASAGLNLLAERIGMRHVDGAAFGPPDSPLVLEGAWEGPIARGAPWPRIVERLGGDLAPIDATSAEGRLALEAYCWPDQEERRRRLRGALELARREPPRVERIGAAALLARIAPEPGVTTVVWHSIMWQYLGPEEAAVAERERDRILAAATAEAPAAHLAFEPARRHPGAAHEFLVTLEHRPGDSGPRIIASAPPHGIPVRGEGLEEAASAGPSERRGAQALFDSSSS